MVLSVLKNIESGNNNQYILREMIHFLEEDTQ